MSDIPEAFADLRADVAALRQMISEPGPAPHPPLHDLVKNVKQALAAPDYEMQSAMREYLRAMSDLRIEAEQGSCGTPEHEYP